MLAAWSRGQTSFGRSFRSFCSLQACLLVKSEKEKVFHIFAVVSSSFADLELDPLLEKITVDEVLEEGGLLPNAYTSADNSNRNRAMNTQPDASADCELLLTDYLLNFGEESSKDDGYYDGNCSSGVECDTENCSLASLKKSLKKTKSSKVTGKFPKGSGENKEPGNGVDGQKYVGRYKSNGRLILNEVDKKERERMRSVNYRVQRMEKIKRLETESVELTERNNALSDMNRGLNERISALEDQVEYLENVLANESSLSTILNTLAEHPGLEFQKNSLRLNSLKRKRQDSDAIKDENETTAKKNNCSPSPKSGGICLHLTSGKVSLEFCRECHKSSTRDENE